MKCHRSGEISDLAAIADQAWSGVEPYLLEFDPQLLILCKWAVPSHLLLCEALGTRLGGLVLRFSSD